MGWVGREGRLWVSDVCGAVSNRKVCLIVWIRDRGRGFLVLWGMVVVGGGATCGMAAYMLSMDLNKVAGAIPATFVLSTIPSQSVCAIC